MSKALRYLRIAFSVTCIIACMLLCALWGRSHKFNDALQGRLVGIHNFILTSIEGRVNLTVVDIAYWRLPWRLISQPASDRPAHQIPLWPYEQRFGFKQESDHFDVVAPHWFFVLLLGMFAAIPWLRLRFSLRALLVATTLIAVLLGLIVWVVR